MNNRERAIYLFEIQDTITGQTFGLRLNLQKKFVISLNKMNLRLNRIPDQSGFYFCECKNIIPGWIGQLGMGKPFCFLQDVINFKNPFQKKLP